MSKELIRLSKEEMASKLAQMREEAEKHVKSYNEAMFASNLDAATKADNAVKELINDYTAIVRKLCFEECKATEDPMMEAVKRMYYVTIAVKDVKEKDLNFSVRSLIEKEKPIELRKLHDYCKGGIGKDPNWIYMAERMNSLLTIKTADAIGVDAEKVRNAYPLSEIAKGFKFGEDANFMSTTSMQKGLQVVINAMIGEEYKVVSRDVKYLLACYTREGKKLQTVRVADQNTLAKYLMAVCNRIVNNGRYDLECKEIDRAQKSKK